MDDRQTAQQRWAAQPIQQRLRVLAKARGLLAFDPSRLVSTSDGTSPYLPPDSLTSEVLPLLAAIRFLEQSAASILKPRRLGRKGLPLWLRGVHSQIQRVPFGKILVIGPSNYPLFLPGVQAVQALAAGNAVIWKPGRGGSLIAQNFASILAEAGLPAGLLSVTDDSVAAAEHAIATGVDKVFLTGSVASGRALLHQLADRLIPSVVELSGCDATIVLPGADMARVVKAITFGVRLNGSSTCMAPRRILLVGSTPQQKSLFVQQLQQAFQAVAPVALPASTKDRLASLLNEAKAAGASILGDIAQQHTRPILVDDGDPSMAVAQEDIFAPVVTLIPVRNTAEVVAAQAQCPFGLTASIFGPESDCRALAQTLEVGTVFINDLIFPSADPRLPFGGRRLSGFGVTQGAEGLLEMTAIKTVFTQRSSDERHYEVSEAQHLHFFLGFIRAVYADRFTKRLRGIVSVIREGRHLR